MRIQEQRTPVYVTTVSGAWVYSIPTGFVGIKQAHYRLHGPGEVAAVADIDSYMADHPANRWFYGRNLCLFVTPCEEPVAQIEAFNLDPLAVRHVVMTHLQGDHAGGFRGFPCAEVTCCT